MEIEYINDYFITSGYLKYYTKWILLDCDDEICNYYKWFYCRETGNKLMKPRNGAHISIVRGEEEGITGGLWERNLEGPKVFFSVNKKLQENEEYVWLNVSSRYLSIVRLNLGLSMNPQFGFHLTIGKKYE